MDAVDIKRDAERMQFCPGHAQDASDMQRGYNKFTQGRRGCEMDAAGMPPLPYWMQGMYCGFCGTALFSFHPAVSCFESAGGRVYHRHLVSLR